MVLDEIRCTARRDVSKLADVGREKIAKKSLEFP